MRFPKPPKRRKNKKYLAWITTFPCVVCGNPQTQAHHVRLGHNGGMSRKPDDSRAVPLCYAHHDLLHKQGEWEFWNNTEREDGSAFDPEELIYSYNITFHHIYGERP